MSLLLNRSVNQLFIPAPLLSSSSVDTQWQHADGIVCEPHTYKLKQQLLNVKSTIYVCMFTYCVNRGEKIRFAHLGIDNPAFQKHPYIQEERHNQIQFTIHTEHMQVAVICPWPTHQMNSLQWKQKVGWRRKVDMNLCPLTWWILRLTAPCRFLVNCL